MERTQITLAAALLDLTEAIAEPDEVGKIAHSRAKLIKILLKLLPAGSNSTGLLWLVDCLGDSHFATMWVATNSKHSIHIPDEPPLRVPVGPLAQASSPAPTEGECPSKYNLSVRNPTVQGYVKLLLRRGDFPAPCLEYILPLQSAEYNTSRHPIAFLHIISDAVELPSCFPTDPTFNFAAAISKAFGARIVSGRERRINSAITAFQKAAESARTSLQLAQATSQVLLDYAGAVSCAIYKRNGRNGLRLWVESHLGFPSPKIVADESFTYWAFASPWGDDRLFERKSIRLASLQEDGPKIFLLASQSFDDELPHELNPGATSWLSYVVCCTSSDGHRTNTVPLVLIRLLTTQSAHFLGGAFSATGETIVGRVASYFGELLPGLLLQEAMGEINKGAPALQNRIRDRIARSEILLREREFARLIKRTVPSVEDVLIAERRKKDGNELTVYWKSEGKTVSQRLPFAWPKRLRFDPPGRKPTIRNSVLDLYLYEIDNRAFGFRCYLDYRDLAEHEWKIIEYILGELRFAALGALDVSEKTIQIAELRHALRAGLTGLLGHLKVATDLYSETHQAYRDGSTEIALRRVFQEAQFRKSLERARLSGEQISTFFEDTRVLLSDITKESLQKSSFDVLPIIDELRTLFLTEINRRRLTITTEQVILSRSIIYDRTLLKLALFNLLDNAIKYSFSENVVTITGDFLRGQIQIGIHNIGPFIPFGDIRDQIFEPFRRIKHAGVQAMPGTGLGLAATRRIAEVHGGTIRVDSVPVDRADGITRARTSFTIIIPNE